VHGAALPAQEVEIVRAAKAPSLAWRLTIGRLNRMIMVEKDVLISLILLR
jgi:hypothetical protein